MVKEVSFSEVIPKAEFIYACDFNICEHNYFCACCKEKSAVLDMNTGILQPCWDCQKEYTVIEKRSWLGKFINLHWS